jgi:hypothetical protein
MKGTNNIKRAIALVFALLIALNFQTPISPNTKAYAEEIPEEALSYYGIPGYFGYWFEDWNGGYFYEEWGTAAKKQLPDMSMGDHQLYNIVFTTINVPIDKEINRVVVYKTPRDDTGITVGNPSDMQYYTALNSAGVVGRNFTPKPNGTTDVDLVVDMLVLSTDNAQALGTVYKTYIHFVVEYVEKAYLDDPLQWKIDNGLIDADVDASLEIDVPNSLVWNYKDFENNKSKFVDVDLDARGTQSDLPITSYDFSLSVNGDTSSHSGTNPRYGKEYRIYPGDLSGGTIRVNGSVTATNSANNSDMAVESKTIEYDVVNERPDAYFSNSSNNYVTLPVTFTNLSSDPEDDLEFVSWTIRNSNGDYIFYSDTNLKTGVVDQDYTPEYFDLVDFDSDGGQLVFTESDNYNVEIYVRDSGGGYGKKDDSYSRSVYVNTEPQPPIADFSMYEFGYPNESVPIRDMSTDSNDDIVTWTWTKPTINNDDGTPAAVSGNLNGKNGGSLTFSKEGTYDVSLFVRDYTNLSDSITKSIKIIPPVPVARITAEGAIKENRKVTLHMRDSLSPRTDQIQTSRNIWKITPLDGQSPTSIKIDTDTSNLEEKNIVFKEIGRYEVYLKVHNNFSDSNPTHPNIAASEIIEVITVTKDLDPISEFTVGGATPNFKDNPVKTTVDIRQNARSIDDDIIAKYKYVIYRDMDEDGDFSDEAIYGTYNVGDTAIDVFFQQGVSGAFKADLEVTEEFGQPTIEKFVTASDRRKNISSQEFYVNWVPDISFSIPEWEYAYNNVYNEDSVIDISTVLKDEEISTLQVDWSIKRASESDINVMEDDDIDVRTEYDLDNNGGAIKFLDSGYYELIATVTDEVGQSYSFSDFIRIYPLPEAVIEDAMTYGGTPFTTKENRKYQLSGSGSYGHDYYGVALHEIDHSKDYWEVTPLDGQDSNVVKIVAGSGQLPNDIVSSTTFLKLNDALEEDLLFKEKGRYEIKYQVTNVYGKKSPIKTEIITVVEDTKPIIDFDIVEKTYRDVDDSKRAELVVYNLQSSSNDGDILTEALHRVRYRFDSDNDGSFADETWSSPMTIDFTNKRVAIKVSHVGKYQFEFYVKDTYGQDTIEQFVTDVDRRSNVVTKVIEVDNMPPNVDFTVTPSNKVDVVFTVGQVDKNKILELDTKINNYIKMYLEANNADFIDTRIETIETSTISTSEQGAEAILGDWRSVQIPQDFSGSFSDLSGGWRIADNQLYATGGYRPARGYINPSADAYKTAGAEIDFTWGIRSDASSFSHGEAGFMFRIKDDRNYYVYIMDNHSACGNVRYNYTEVLVKVVNGTRQIINTNSFPSFYKGQKHDFNIKLEGNNIKVYRDGSLRFDYTDTNNPHEKGSYGFYVWDQYGAYFSDIAVSSQSIKTLDEVLKEPTWRQDASKFVINLSDTKLPELEPTSPKYPVVLSRMMSDELYFAELGTNTNRAQVNNFIADNDGKGTFIYNTNMDTALQNLAVWILNTVRSQARPTTQYILLNEEVNYETYYDDYEEDPQMNFENWRYVHDYDYFQNDLGKVDYDGLWLSNAITSFDKIGRFVTEYRTKDNPVGTNDKFDDYRKDSQMKNGPLNIYVHRKPIAQFTMDMTKGVSTFGLTLTDTSYDLDHTNRDDMGLINREWSWKRVGDSSWTSGKLTSGNNTEEYLVRLRVQDMDGENGVGVWSDDTVVLITSQAMPPIAQFALSNRVIAQGANLGITDTSYDPNGDEIVRWEWKLYKEGSLLGTYTAANSQTTINNKIASAGIGDFRITLQVSDSSGVWGDPLATSEIYTQTFKVVPVNHPPSADFNLLGDHVAWSFPRTETVSVTGSKTFRHRPSAATFFFEEFVKYDVQVSDSNGADNLGFLYEWTLENYKIPKLSGIGSANLDSVKTYETEKPFAGIEKSFSNQGLGWGAYRITLKVTDMPKIPPYEVGSELSTYVTKNYYIVPDLSIVGNFTSTNPEIIVGDTIELYATTNKEVTAVSVTLSNTTVDMTKKNTAGETVYWEGNIQIPESITETGTYDLAFKAVTNYGSESGAITKEVASDVPIDIIALRLLNFRITNIVNHYNVTYPYTKDMLISSLINYKAGYYVTFQIDSKGSPDNVYAHIYENGIKKQDLTLTRISTSGSNATWQGKFFTVARLMEGTEISIKLDCKKGATVYDFNEKERWDGRSLRVSGSALGDGRINLIQ